MLRTQLTRTLPRPLLLRPLLLLPSQSTQRTQAPFTTTTPTPKKSSKSHSHGEPLREKQQQQAATGKTSSPFDYDTFFQDLETQCASHIDRLKTDLSRLRASGRNETGVLESVQVVLDKRTGATASLRDIAHVLSKGRTLGVTVYEVTNVKHVVSAIQRANLNVQPILDPKNPQLIHAPLPPPTKESRAQVAEVAGRSGEKVVNLLRSARMERHKVLKGLKKERPDDVRKADARLEVIMKKMNADAKKVIDEARRSILEN